MGERLKPRDCKSRLNSALVRIQPEPPILWKTMTRINLVPVEELHDQHLFAEFREIKMIPRSLERSLVSRTEEQITNSIPEDFCLGRGHVSFFYDKGRYLRERYLQIKQELAYRGINFDRSSVFDPNNTMAHFTSWYGGDWAPSEYEMGIIRARIKERVATKPDWYRKTIR